MNAPLLKFEAFGELVQKLNNSFEFYFYLFLPIFFGLSLLFSFARNPVGGFEFLESTKRLVIAVILMAGFKEITAVIFMIANGVASNISNMNDLAQLNQMAQKNLERLPMTASGILLGGNSLVFSFYSLAVSVFLFAAQYLVQSVYYFCYYLLALLAPLILLFHLISPKISLGLFRAIAEIACWPIIWAVLSAMLSSMPFGDALAVDDYGLLLFFFIFIGIVFLASPFLVHAIVSGALGSVTTSLGPLAIAAAAALPAKAAMAQRFFSSGATRFPVRSIPKIGAPPARALALTPGVIVTPPPPPPKRLPPGAPAMVTPPPMWNGNGKSPTVYPHSHTPGLDSPRSNRGTRFATQTPKLNSNEETNNEK
jgi:hypothetical protein